MKMKAVLALLFALSIIISGCMAADPDAYHSVEPSAQADSIPIADSLVEPSTPTDPEPAINTEVTPKSDWEWNGLHYGGNFTILPLDEGRTDTIPAYWDLSLGTVAVSNYVQQAMETYPDDTVILVEVSVTPTLHLRGMSYEDDPEAWSAEVDILKDEIRARLTAAGYTLCPDTQCDEAAALNRILVFIPIGQLRELHCGDDVTVLLTRGVLCIH